MPPIVMGIPAAMVVLLGATLPASANSPGPVKDRAWGACKLSQSIRNSLASSIKSASGNKYSSVSVDFIVVHSISLDNNGQPLTTGGHSGAILCTFQGASAATATQETTPIPNATNHPASTNIDILSNQQQSVLQYELNNGTLAGNIEKRVCQTTDRNTDCFRVYKP
jgi:hypothetical protein